MKRHSFSDKAGTRESDELVSGLYGSSGEENRYFSGIASLLRFLEFLFLFGLIIFVAVSATVNAGKITRENIQYIFRNFAFSLDRNTEFSTEIIYSPDSGQAFALYGQGLAVSGNSGIRIFSATGRNTCNSDFVLAEARLASSSRYAGVYEFGGKDYYLFNSFSRVYHGTAEKEILGMSVADNGCFIIVSGDSEYASSVLLFRSDFSLQTAYRKNSRVISSVLSGDGERLVIATLDVNSSGQYLSEISCYSVADEALVSSVKITGPFPLRVFICGDGYGILCKDRVLLFSADGIQKKEIPFNGLEAVSFDRSDDMCAVVLKETGNGLSVNFHLLLIPSETGSQNVGIRLTSTPVSLSVYGDRAYVLSESNVYSYSPSGKTGFAEVKGKPEGRAILAYAEGKVYYLCNSSAYTVSVD